ncbi:MAG: hypothetical protein JXJ04_03790 [Spirochaetales bacterium]|nr:hypothetical protein [Spirochaetales bacterium]
MKKNSNFCINLIKCGLLLFLFSVFFTSLLYGQEPIRDDRAWFDPYDTQNPLFYSDYVANLTTEEKSSLVFTNLPLKTKTATPPVQGTIMVIVNAGLYPSVETEVDNYTNQLAFEGYDIVLYTSSNGFNKSGVISLRQQISVYRNENGLNGCIFIGKLPSAWFQFNNDFERMYAQPPAPEPTPVRYGVNYVEFPCDLFFMDMDGTWEDNLGYDNKTTDPEEVGGADEIFDTHNPGTGNTEAEIWVARICANTLGGGTEAAYVRDYIMNKNLAVRNNYSISDYGALYYEDNSSTLSSGDLETGLDDIYGADNVIKPTPPPTDRANYFSNLINSTKYEWVHIGVRSSSLYHHFGDNKASTTDVINSSSLPTGSYGTKILDVIGSSINRYIEQDYIGGKYLFNNTNTILTVIGSTKSGGLTEYASDLCSHFSTGTIGDGFLQWMKTLKNENPLINDYRRIAYGMTILGDPTLRQKAQDGIEVNIQKGINFLLQDGQQLENGSWSNNASVTAFSALALLNSGYYYDSVLAEASEPGLIKGNWVVSKAIKYLLEQVHVPAVDFNDDVYGTLSVSWINNPPDVSAVMRTYYTSSAILPLAAAARNPTITIADRNTILDALEKLRNFFICGQMDSQSITTMTNPAWEGGFGYLTYAANPDNSNTQFAIMGVRVANDTFRVFEDSRELDLWDPENTPTIDDGTLNKCVDKWLETTRNDNGQHGYRGKDSYESTMTAAALWTYAMCGYPTGGPEIKEPDYVPTSADILRSSHAADALSAAATYLDGLGSFNGSSYAGTYYFTYTLAKALAMNRQDQIVLPTREDIQWYPQMCDFLINGNNFAGSNITTGQEINGSWPTKGLNGVHGGAILSTAGAIQLNTAWNINTLRIQRLPGEANENGPEDFTLAFSLMSYSDLHIYDNEARHVGRKKLTYSEMVGDEEVEKTIYFAQEQIPGSSYKIYEKDQYGNFIREATFNEFEDGIIPEANPPECYGYAQVVKIKNAQPDSLRVEIQGTSTGTFDLDVKLVRGDEVIKNISYNDQPIQKDQVTHCYAKLVNIEGMEMYNEPLEKSAVTWIDETMIREWFKPGTTNEVPIEFEIKNLATDVEMRNVSVTCSNIQGSNGVIINAIEDINFEYNTLIDENSSTMVYCYISVPANFIGPGEGEIKVTSANGNVKTRRIRILTNRPPNAEAGNDQVHYAGASTNFEATVNLDGSGSSDPEDDELNYKWYAGSITGVLLAEGVTPEITLGLGSHTIVLVVEDSKGEKDWDDVVIQVLNRAPTANAGEDISVFAGAYGLPEAKVTLDGAASTDPESDPLTYQWYENEVLIAEGPAPEVILAAGIHTISLVVDDTVNSSQPDEVTVTVTDAIPATMWLWPNKINTRGCWGLFNTTITLPAEIKREDIDDSFRIQLFTKDGESIESFYDRIFPYLKNNHHHKDKNTTKLMENKGFKCYVEKLKKVKIVSVFFKRYLLDLLKEEGSYTLYAVGRLKSGEYFNAAAKLTLFDPFHFYHHHHHHK